VAPSPAQVRLGARRIGNLRLHVCSATAGRLGRAGRPLPDGSPARAGRRRQAPAL